MAGEKTVRLSKATKELGVGLDHIVEFLAKNGIKLAKNPNAKITADAYVLLQQEFQQDKEIKKVAAEITKEKFRKENIVIEAPPAVKKEEPAKDEAKDTLVEELINIKKEAVEKQKRTVKKTATKKTTAKKKEKEKEKPEAVEPETKKAKKPAARKAKAAPAEEEEPKKKAPVKKAPVKKAPVKKAPAKKAPRKAAEKKAEEEVAEVPKEEVPAAPAAPPAPVEEAAPPPVAEAEPPAEVKPEAEEKTDSEGAPYRTEREKLSGPTILGKIDLPKVPEKKKPAASSDDQKKKKRRKRTDKKVNISRFQSQTQDTGSDWKQRRGDQRRGRHKGPAPELSDKQIKDQISATLARLSGGKSRGGSRRKQRMKDRKKESAKTVQKEETGQKTIKVTEFVSANELANLIGVPVTDVISACMSLGMFVSINQRLDAETLSVVAEEFNCKVEFVSADVSEAIQESEDSEEDLSSRAPIVTVMGHVDHGKTSLLDYIRSANVIAGEAGGITQHIGAYEVTLDNGKKIAFLDTPGHEAFTAMRARGAQLTDVAIIVIAADDSIMPQTVEAINHAQAAGVPIVIAINKIDREDANPEKIKEELSKMNILVEDWGGKFQSQEISAKTGKGVDALQEKVLLEAELLDLKANAGKNAKGTVIESELDKGRGFVSTVLVQTGTLKMGDVVLAGCYSGRVKAMFNERGQRMDEAGPSTPAMILGLDGAAQAGDQFNVLDDEREARDIANKRMQLQREQGIRTHKHITLDEIGRRLAIGSFRELNIIIKGDVDGSIEALSDSMLKLSTEEVQVNVIHKSVGAITESDVLLASASNAIIVGFQVRPSMGARKLAEQEQIDIRLYSIIYDAINEVKDAMEGMLAPEYEEKITCNIEVREVFKIPKVGAVAGCRVMDGKVTRNTNIRIIRDGIVAFTGQLASLKRFKDDVKEVATGFECGLSVENYNDIKVGDIIEGYEQVAVKRTLA